MTHLAQIKQQTVFSKPPPRETESNDLGCVEVVGICPDINSEIDG